MRNKRELPKGPKRPLRPAIRPLPPPPNDEESQKVKYYGVRAEARESEQVELTLPTTITASGDDHAGRSIG
ncbi:MAG: hypothetical protein LC790_19130, partial [Actinobacteria bacterium]|nr:hypothetical protein [Actinomycetota bacterium]